MIHDHRTEHIDWSAIRLEYITGNISYRKLAEKHQMSERTLMHAARREGWHKKREEWREKTVAKAAQKASARVAAKEADKLVKMRLAADSMADVLERVLDDVDQFKRHLITTGLGDGVTKTECRVEDKFDTRAIKDTTTALRDLTTALRNLYELPTVQERQAMDIAAERLRLDQAKTRMGDDDEQATGVVMMPARIAADAREEQDGGEG